MTIQANQGFGVSVFGATGSGSGGTTSPGGSSLQIQYNAAGSFGGMAGTSWDNTNRSLTLTGATVTTSNPVLNLSQTWNAGAVTFTGWKLNVINTASGASSLLMDLQVDGGSKFSIDKSGKVTVGNQVILGSSSSVNTTFSNDSMAMLGNGSGFQVYNGGFIGFSSTGSSVGTADTKLYRDAANTLALRNGTSAQTFNTYYTYTDASNYGRLSLSWSSGQARIGANIAGTGGASELAFSSSGADAIKFYQTNFGTLTWLINGAGHFLAGTDNNYDIGATSSGRPRDFYGARDLYCGRNMAVVGTFQWNSGSQMTAPANGNILMRDSATTSFGLLQFGGTTSSFPALKRSSATLQVRLADDSAYAQLTASSLLAAGSAGVGYTTGAGGAVTQATDRTTGVTLDKICGQITLVSAAGTATWQTFTVTNNTVAATDTIRVVQASGTDLYQIFVTNVAAGSFKITFATTGGTTTEQPVFNFSVIKSVAA